MLMASLKRLWKNAGEARAASFAAAALLVSTCMSFNAASRLCVGPPALFWCRMLEMDEIDRLAVGGGRVTRAFMIVCLGTESIE